MKEQAAGDQQRMGNRRAAAGADVDLAGAALAVEPAHALHLRGVEDSRQLLPADVADRLAVEHVALAAGVDIAVVLDVHRPAPEIVAGVAPVGGGVAGLGPHQVGFVGLHAHLVNARHGGPEAEEVIDLVPVLLHADHLDNYLDPGAGFVLAAAEVEEVVADTLEAGALAVELEALFGGAVEAQGDVFERARQDALGGCGVEQGAVGGEQGVDAVAVAVFDAVVDPGVEEGFAEPDQHHMLAGLAGLLHEALEDLTGHVLFGLLVRLAWAHGAVEVALGRGLDDVLHRQRLDALLAAQVGPQQFRAIPDSHLLPLLQRKARRRHPMECDFGTPGSPAQRRSAAHLRR